MGVLTGFAVLALVSCSQSDDERRATKVPSRASLVAAHTESLSPRDQAITIFKSPTCGCCTKWASYLERNGFEVVLRDTRNLAATKDALGVPKELRSCHTATIGDYVIEGHVPVEDIRRLIASEPRGLLAVPGMPRGSPGMEHPKGGSAYDTLYVDANGAVRVFGHHPARRGQ